jgi:hypothetical protein
MRLHLRWGSTSAWGGGCLRGLGPLSSFSSKDEICLESLLQELPQTDLPPRDLGLDSIVNFGWNRGAEIRCGLSGAELSGHPPTMEGRKNYIRFKQILFGYDNQAIFIPFVYKYVIIEK